MRPLMSWQFYCINGNSPGRTHSFPGFFPGVCFWMAGVAGAVFLLGINHAGAVQPDRAAVLFGAFSNAFCRVEDPGMCVRADQRGGPEDFWKEAEEVEVFCDGAQSSHPCVAPSAVNGLLKNFIARHGTDWTGNAYNDDCMWACIAFLRGAQVTHQTPYLEVARHNFDRVCARAWDAGEGGGLFWTTANQSRNACVNGPAGIAACLLYQAQGHKADLVLARKIFAWERSHLFDPATGAVSDALDHGGHVNHWASSYNQGTFIGLASLLGQFRDAARAADFTWHTLAVSGLLPDYHSSSNNAGFNSIFIRWMAQYARAAGCMGQYRGLLEMNANRAWQVRRLGDNLSWSAWQSNTPPTLNLRAWNCVNSLEVVESVIGLEK